MTVAVVPYVEQNLSHSAALFRQALASSFSNGGVLGLGELAIAAQSSPNMTVQVGAGRAIVPGTQVSAPTLLGGGAGAFTSQGDYFCYNDGTISVTISPANATNPRIDAVYIGAQDSFYSGATNTALIGVVTGNPAPSPVAPPIPNNSVLLGYVAVAANVTSIVNGNITQAQVLAAPTIGGYTVGAFSPTGIYSAGSPTPQVEQLGSRTYLEGIVASSNATFATGNTYTLGSIPSTFAPVTTRTFACLTNISATGWVTVSPTGTITLAVGVTFTGLLNLTLENCSWRTKGF